MKYRGVIIDKSFIDPEFPKKFKPFAKKESGDWKIYGIEVEEKEIDQVIIDIRENMKEGSWYSHFYRGDDLIVVFKEKGFVSTINPETWVEIREYAEKLGIPREQMEIKPVRPEEEKEYFGVKE